MHPLAVDATAITDQDPSPPLDQHLKGLLAAAGLYLEEGHRGVDYHPQPGQHPILIPGGLVDVIDRPTASFLANGLVMRCDRFCDPIHRALNGAPADGYPQDRRAKLLDRAATVPLTPRQLADERRQPR